MTSPRRLKDTDAIRTALERALGDDTQTLGQFFLARFMGFAVSYVEETCVVEFEVKEFLLNPGGTLHGGVIATALDIAMGHLVQHLAGPGATAQLNVNYHRPTSSGRVRCKASVQHRGRKLWFMQAFAEDEAGEVLASAGATMALHIDKNSNTNGKPVEQATS